MSYAKYVLSKTGLFPKLDPSAADVLDAVNRLYEIDEVETKRGHRYYYIIPLNDDLKYLRGLTDIFSSNGVILRPHRSKHYQRIVFRVPNRSQRFLSDVMDVYQDRAKYQNVLVSYNKKREK